MFKPCAVIPVYNHEHAVTKVVATISIPCILVDDGSSQNCKEILQKIPNITLLSHTYNQGKGAAVLTGIRHAYEQGFTHVLQIDADGQHNAQDIPKFLALAKQHPHAVITGHPEYDASVPRLRLYARYLTHVWIWINTLSLHIKDSMCGFRVYPLKAVIQLSNKHTLTQRMNFDPEILVRLYWQGCNIINVKTRVGYPSDGISHFRLVYDNVLISLLHATLFFGMLIRLPKLLRRRS